MAKEKQNYIKIKIADMQLRLELNSQEDLDAARVMINALGFYADEAEAVSAGAVEKRKYRKRKHAEEPVKERKKSKRSWKDKQSGRMKEYWKRKKLEKNMHPQTKKVLEAVRDGTEWFSDISKKTKIGPNSLGMQLESLVRKGFIERIGRGQYREKGKNPPEDEPAEKEEDPDEKAEKKFEDELGESEGND